MAIKKRDQLELLDQGAVGECEIALAHPRLVEFLQEAKYEDGSARKTGTMTFFVEDGAVKLCLNDRDVGETAWVTAATIQDVLRLAEKGLEEGSLGWRKPATPTRGRR